MVLPVVEESNEIPITDAEDVVPVFWALLERLRMVLLLIVEAPACVVVVIPIICPAAPVLA